MIIPKTLQPTDPVKITLLGTGTSQGIPVIGCHCKVCTSTDPHDNRLRSSALIEYGGCHILIDPGPDFRQQMLRAKVQHLDCILVTHEHNDHVIGIDDIRAFNYMTGHPMAVYTLPRVADDFRLRFRYVFAEPVPGLPRIELIHIEKDSRLQIGPATIQAVGIQHGRLPILAFRFGDMAYLTDVKTIEPEELEKLRGVRYLVVNALQIEDHPTHMNLEECLQLIKELQPERAWITHVGHRMGLTKEVTPTLPEGVEMGYDGLVIEWFPTSDRLYC
jgi:phosphoribosyl 1,2-cyclic phosphate phosphodiesterase